MNDNDLFASFEDQLISPEAKKEIEIGKSVIRKNGNIYIRLQDGRMWCPSQQCRGGSYNYTDRDIDRLNEILNPTDTFTAIDVETATTDRMICQIGIVNVVNGQIKDKIVKLVQPPGNQYDSYTMSKHRITPDMTAQSPTFDVVWKNIRKYLLNTTVVAHNKSFDEDAIRRNLMQYHIEEKNLREFCCTYKIFGLNLEKLCQAFDMDCTNHHDALFDAECCAQFYLNYLNGINPQNAYTIDHEDNNITPKTHNAQFSIFNQEFALDHKQLRGDILKKDLSGANPDNPFYNRAIVITGLFTQERSDFAKTLKSMGADINTTITKNTHFVLIGNEPGPKKIEKLDKLIHDGYNIRKLYQTDIDAILSGEWDTYHTEKEAIKELDFTISHFDKNHLAFDNDSNVIYGKELYYGKGFSGNFDLFNQITGNLGASGDGEITSDTNICVLSDVTIEKLKKGYKDETIQYIQDTYNNTKAKVFNFQFMTETDILSFCKRRCDLIGDEVTSSLYNKYISTI